MKRYYGDDFLKLPCFQYKSVLENPILYYFWQGHNYPILLHSSHITFKMLLLDLFKHKNSFLKRSVTYATLSVDNRRCSTSQNILKMY